MSYLVALPIFIPLLTAILCLVSFRFTRLQAFFSVIGVVALLVSAIALLNALSHNNVVVMQAGNWPAPFGITLVADWLSGIMVLVTAILGLIIAVYSLVNIDKARQQHAFFCLYQILLMGVCGAFLTGDLFNLYVFFEIMLITSFVLLTLGGERAQLEGAIKYVVINLIASALFLGGTGILYGEAGTLNMADLAAIMRQSPDASLVKSAPMLLLVAFGIKAAVFPFFFWLPASYHTPPAAISAIFSGLLTKVGVYALIRNVVFLFPQNVDFITPLLFPIAGLTMVLGVLGAAAQNEMRRILSFHIVSQIGYMVMGIALGTPLALAGTIYFIIHNMLVKTGLFLISGFVERVKGTGKIKKLGGFYQKYPLLSVAFLLSAFSLAGLPPFSGFFGKMVLILAAFESEAYLIAGIALVVGLMTLFSMTKIWGEVFWKAEDNNNPLAQDEAALSAGNACSLNKTKELSLRELVCFSITIGVIVTLSLVMVIAFEPIFNLLQKAASQLIDPTHLISAVENKK